jgi:hypothetical protein
MSAWSKYALGWISPSQVTITLPNEPIVEASAQDDVYQFLSGSPLTGGEYFLVENRQLSGFDAGLPAAGLLIWHIDDDISSNRFECYPPSNCTSIHYRVSVEQADGQWNLEKPLFNRGDAGDPFRSPTYTAFANGTTPNSKLYDGSTTNVSVTSISTSSSTMTATLSVQVPDISVSPTSYDFGNIDVGNDSAAQTFTVSNSGVDNLIIGTLLVAGAHISEFDLQNDNCSGQTVSSAGTCTFQVVFSPRSADSKSASVSVPSNDPDEATLSVPLIGVGVSSSGGGGGGGCFIATAAYGSYMHDDVMVLREFRDKYLMTKSYGKAFVKSYYKYSPPIADYIAEHGSLRVVSRMALTPIVYSVKYPFMFGFAVIFGVVAVIKRRRK